MMETESVKAVVRECLLQEFPLMIEREPAIRKSVVRVFRNRFADRDETEDRFERLFQELKDGREEQNKKWAEQDKKWEENTRRLDEQSRNWEKRWEEMNEKSDRKFEALMTEIRDLRSDYTSSIGALGARWGIAAESSFRDALKDILERHFNVEVLNINEFDEEGTVFGRPDQVEIDVIIRNGELIVCEIKSSMSKSQMYIFERKVRFYEKRHDRKVDRIIIISPMVRENARTVAANLGIEIFSYPRDVRL